MPDRPDDLDTLTRQQSQAPSLEQPTPPEDSPEETLEKHAMAAEMDHPRGSVKRYHLDAELASMMTKLAATGAGRRTRSENGTVPCLLHGGGVKRGTGDTLSLSENAAE